MHLTTLEAKIEQGIGRCVNLQEFARLYDSKIYVEPCIAAQYSDFFLNNVLGEDKSGGDVLTSRHSIL